MSDDEAVREFKRLTNMSPHTLAAWLQTDESKTVGWTRDDDGGGESVGHEMGRHLVQILEKHGDYSAADLRRIHKAVGYIKRHLAQGGPAHDKTHSRWAYSLKNWGHDPAHG